MKHSRSFPIPVTLWYPGGPDSSMVEHLVQFQRGLGSSPGPVTFHAAISLFGLNQPMIVELMVSWYVSK